MPSPARGPSPLAIVAGASGAAVLLTLAVGRALQQDGAGAPAPIAAAAPAPSAPAGEAAPEVVAGTGGAGGAAAVALQAAERLAAAEQEGAAVAVLDEWIAAEGSTPAIVTARDRLLATSRDLFTAGEREVRALIAQGRTDEARRRVAGLRARLPRQLGPLLALLDQEAGAPAALASARPETSAPRPGSGAEAPPSGGAPTPPGAAASQDQPELATFRLLARNLAGDPSPDAHFQLGEWALARGLAAEARGCFERAVALDAFHEGARLALGHRQHEGRWYSEEEYQRDVLGLVQGPDGKWAAPTGGGSTVTERPKPSSGSEGSEAGQLPPPPPAPYAEDKGWYQDNEAVCSWADAPVYESKYYKIRSNVKPEYAKRYGKMMDQYFRRFVRVFKDFLPSGRYAKSELWIHSSRDEFMAENPQLGPTVGGFYQPASKRVVCYHGLFGEQGTTRDVLAHEGTHQFQDLVLRGKFWNAPIWILEGLAVLFESAYFDGEEVRIGLVPRERLYALKRGLAAGNLISLRTLLRTPQQSFTGYHYAHAWGLIYMVLYYGEKPAVRRRCQQWFSALFADALERRVTPEHVEQKLGGAQQMRELEAQWHEWIAQLPYDYDPKGANDD